MTPTRRIHALGQRLWLDNITRELLDSGTLARYIDEAAVTGLTSNPSIFDAAIGAGGAYGPAIAHLAREGLRGESLFMRLALDDLRRAADLFAPLHRASGGRDGWVSMEVSPLLCDDAVATVAAAREIHAQADRPNLFVKIPGTEAGCAAIEEATFLGIPVNVTLLFSPAHYTAAADAWMRGLERRLEAGLAPAVESVASVFISRWDVAADPQLPPSLRLSVGIAMAGDTYAKSCRLYATDRWARLAAAGARPQRVLWASTGTKDPSAPDTLYVDRLVAPDTVNTVPEKTLLAVHDHGDPGSPLAPDGEAAREVLASAQAAGLDLQALGARLQVEGARAFVKSWEQLLARIEAHGGGR